MDSQVLNKKIELIQWLSTLDDSSVIEKLLEFRKEETKDWWDSISEEEKASINVGISEADDQQLIPHTTARNLYAKWL